MRRTPDPLAIVPPEVLRELRGHHAEPHRAYHTWQHIEELLGYFDEVRRNLRNPQAVLFATLFHDAIYDPRRSDNEERSAGLLAARAAPALHPAVLAVARRLILATRGHELPAGIPANEVADAALFLDMDLAILAAPPRRFEEYERQIRAEYGHVPEAAFRAGRLQVLKRFVEREPLYLSEWGQARFERQAAANLKRALAALEQA